MLQWHPRLITLLVSAGLIASLAGRLGFRGFGWV
jgi:hypothetical protein